MTDLRGKRAFVTGASRGVGREIARGLADLGCELVLHSRSLEGTREMVQELSAKGVKVRAVAGELADAEERDRVLDEVGPVDVLYNNAAIGSRFFEDPWEVTAEEMRRVFEVDTVAPILICGRLVPGMLERGFGRVINVTSGIRDQPQRTPYAIAKAALDKYVRDFAPALSGTGVTMNLLDPGWLRTDLGGPNAPGDVASVVPGALVPALLDDEISGRWFNAQEYAGRSVSDAVRQAVG